MGTHPLRKRALQFSVFDLQVPRGVLAACKLVARKGAGKCSPASRAAMLGTAQSRIGTYGRLSDLTLPYALNLQCSNLYEYVRELQPTNTCSVSLSPSFFLGPARAAICMCLLSSGMMKRSPLFLSLFFRIKSA